MTALTLVETQWTRTVDGEFDVVEVVRAKEKDGNVQGYIVGLGWVALEDLQRDWTQVV